MEVIKIVDDYFEFSDAGELRDWLNQFKETDLSTVYLQSDRSNHLTLHWQEETLTDGSKVNNIKFW